MRTWPASSDVNLRWRAGQYKVQYLSTVMVAYPAPASGWLSRSVPRVFDCGSVGISSLHVRDLLGGRSFCGPKPYIVSSHSFDFHFHPLLFPVLAHQVEESPRTGIRKAHVPGKDLRPRHIPANFLIGSQDPSLIHQLSLRVLPSRAADLLIAPIFPARNTANSRLCTFSPTLWLVGTERKNDPSRFILRS